MASICAENYVIGQTQGGEISGPDSWTRLGKQ